MSGGGHGRRISSVSVTYQEEFHQQGPPAVKPTVVNVPGICGPGDQTLEGLCEEFPALGDVEELNVPSSFYSLSQQSCPSSCPMLQHQAIPLGPAPSNTMPAAPPTTGTTLYALEDSLRHKVNIQIENFRASVQQILCEQFTLHRYPPPLPPPHTDSHTVPSANVVQSIVDDESLQQNSESDSCSGIYHTFAQDDSVYSNEPSTSTDSGLGVEPSLEHQLDLSLLQLLTCSIIISNALRRAEYAVSEH